MTNPDLTNLRSECERAIALSAALEFATTPTVGGYHAALCAFNEHSRTHSPCASRALLRAVEALSQMVNDPTIDWNSSALEFNANDGYERLDAIRQTLAAIAAEFSGGEGK